MEDKRKMYYITVIFFKLYVVYKYVSAVWQFLKYCLNFKLNLKEKTQQLSCVFTVLATMLLLHCNTYRGAERREHFLQ